MSPDRIEFAKFATPFMHTDIISIISIDQKVKSNFKILTTFEPITWWFLLISLLLISLVNIKSRKNFLFNFLISSIDHFECLLTKKSKSRFNYIKSNCFVIKVGSLSTNRIYKSSYLFWIFFSFFLMTIFSNDILSKLISPSYESIDSIDQLNQHSDITTLIWKDSFIATKSLVLN